MLSKKDDELHQLRLITYVHNDVKKNKFEILVIGHKKFIEETISNLRQEALLSGQQISEQQITKLIKMYNVSIEKVLGIEAMI